MTTEAILRADAVSHSFDEVEVIDDISVDVEPGEVMAIVGPNGSGKTTLLRVLAGLLPSTDGTVEYRGPDREREIGYLPQRPTFRPGFTVRETIDFYRALVDEEGTDRLSQVGLADAADRRVEALSGGMTRLLGIAQATVGDPPVVVLDEPGSGLDPGMRRRTFEVTNDLADDGTAVLVSSHDLSLVERTADRVLVLDRGTVVADGSPDELLGTHGMDSLWDVFGEATTGSTDAVDVAGVTQ
ncbi:ABC transporter ATP-binding protein [Natranaeroarchaeum aerophilus]|uniref:ABC transporter ATP-binding protein n=1 Tax=Natranaeroarchaeum aerophilus TaxID=2917711 RepID=A0AAE3FP32_9EURY|nr:ABC transporter ATP-binding protein [Natranaeroarchaeum aerophilus]MCL9813067.1 ABC transporter ATP-binding protein [Natranaeroarchaeum aerophilus]